MLFRSFLRVQTRVLFHMQAEIQKLESELDEADGKINMEDGDRLRNGDWEFDRRKCDEEKSQGRETRNDLLENIRVKCIQYGE